VGAGDPAEVAWLRRVERRGRGVAYGADQDGGCGEDAGGEDDRWGAVVRSGRHALSVSAAQGCRLGACALAKVLVNIVGKAHALLAQVMGLTTRG
jgi:hypothetical protein